MKSMRLKWVWELGADRPASLEPRLLELLRAVAESGSLQRATRRLGMSYRYAWGLVGRWSQRFGAPLIHLERGRGARLAPLGEKLIEADERVRERLGAELANAAAWLEGEIRAFAPAGALRLRVDASHDLALARLRELAEPALQLDLHFRGSLESLASLGRSQCEVAGFHIAEGRLGAALAAPYRQWLRAPDLRLIQFVTRTQGLMVAAGNPKRIRNLADLKRRGVKLVNRQAGSGTRLLLDRMLVDAGVDPHGIAGYDMEEFTHGAVAATVASGMADAGFGVEAAARQLGLHFIPTARERYLLACRKTVLDTAGGAAFVKLIAGRAFRTAVKALPGYEARGAGKISVPGEALPWLLPPAAR
ncbi:MAG: helix-turn-helix transcriptional regulator [Betaproteobacteria bacterium]|nr:helix-turn-helix transcriptional regulator [Betaproteobacteria bacterium]